VSEAEELRRLEELQPMRWRKEIPAGSWCLLFWYVMMGDQFLVGAAKGTWPNEKFACLRKMRQPPY
jgi:hypothetical protein